METINNLYLKNFKRVIGQNQLTSLSIVNGEIQSHTNDKITYKELDLKDCIICPGFIDPQVNGLNDLSFWDIEENDLSKIDTLRIELAKTGVTGFCPTIITNSKDRILKSIDLINKYIQSSKNKPGAKIIGIHLEGIFISKYGVHEEKYVNKEITPQGLEPFIKENVTLFTLAPELDKTGEGIKLLNENNILVSCGHTSATYNQGEEILDKYKIKVVTHMFNAMKGVNGFNHRGKDGSNLKILLDKISNESKINRESDGIILSILKNKNVSCMAIPDNVHISKEVLSFLIRHKGIENFIPTTDLVSKTFFEEEEKKGILGGGQMTFDNCISILIQLGIAQIEDILTSGSQQINNLLKPAKDMHFGKIEIGKSANLVIWDTNKNKLKGTIIGQNIFLNI